VSQSLILDADGAQALRAQGDVAGDNSGPSGDSLRRVVALANGDIYETRFDRATGLPMEENLFAAGRLRVQRTMTYQPVAGSALFARVRQVTQFALPSDPQQRMLVEETFTPTVIR
jgi:hypothetical protein